MIHRANPLALGLGLAMVAVYGQPLSAGTAPAEPLITAPASANANSTGLTASVTNPVAGVTYSWRIYSGSGSIVSGATTPNLVFSVGTPGVLTLSCSASNAYGSSSAGRTVQVNAVPPAATVITAPANATPNTTGFTASVPAQSGCSYAWTISDGTLVSGASANAATFSTSSPGVLTLDCTVSNAYGSVSAQSQVQVVAAAPLTPVITAPSQAPAYSTALVASIPAQSGCSYAWTVTGGTLVSGQGTPCITFAAAAAGTLKLACTVTNGYQLSASGQASVAVVPDTLLGYYGSGLNVDSLANTPIGQSADFQLSYRIRCNHSAPLQDFRPYFIWSSAKAGYAAGTGGTIQIQLQSDDGSAAHNPSGTVLATAVYSFGTTDINTSTGNNYPEIAFNTQPQLVAGTLYHLVFSNIDADPVDNWVSVDSAYMDVANSPCQPTIADTDLQTLMRTGNGAWSVRGSEYTPVESYTPIVELDYADGASQGQGYMEFWVYDGMPISGTQGVRETFTVSGSTRTVASVAVRVKYISGSSPLTISLEDGEGNVIDSETVPAADIPVPPGFSGNSWAQVTFATPRSLVAGQSYNLALSAPAGTEYTAYPIRKGSDKGFSSTAVYTDGYAQFNPGTGWVGWTQWGVSGLTDSDLQFYFDVVN